MGLTGPVVAVVAVVAIAAAVFGPDAFKLSALPVYAPLALSLNFLVCSHRAAVPRPCRLFGLGAFGVAIATTTWELPPMLGFLAGPVLAGAAAAALGIASLRVRGLYLAVLTLAFGVVLQAVRVPHRDVLPGRRRPGRSHAPEVGPFDLGDDGTFLAACGILLLLVWVGLRRLERVPLLRGLVAIRGNQTGFGPGHRSTRLGVVGFTISGVLAGLAGVGLCLPPGHRGGIGLPGCSCR